MSHNTILRAAFGLSLLVMSLSSALIGQEGEGERLYRVHCQACHGQDGKGDGPMKEQLDVPLPDLTTMAGRNDGEFPAERAHQIIDGRLETPAHGTRQMPVWGFTFQAAGRDTDQEDEVRALITALTAYLESIQSQESARQKSQPSDS